MLVIASPTEEIGWSPTPEVQRQDFARQGVGDGGCSSWNDAGRVGKIQVICPQSASDPLRTTIEAVDHVQFKYQYAHGFNSRIAEV